MRLRKVIAVLVAVGGSVPSAAAGAAVEMRLMETIARGARSLGATVTAEQAAVLSRLPRGAAAELAGLLGRAAGCTEATARFARESSSRLFAASVDDAVVEHVRLMEACAPELEAAARRTAAALRVAEGLPDVIDVWPLLRIDTAGTNDVYRHDYVAVVDLGGNDAYLNNAGGNLLDIRRGPPGSAAPQIAPARGCRHAGDLAAIATLELRTDPECVPGTAVLLDASGNDTYGAFETPGPRDDGLCTPDKLVRRIMTGGAGFAGVGLLLDDGGNDTYLGKTGALGAGHLGVGLLRDRSGNDTYRAIRNSQGFGLLEGVGDLIDESGNDSYDFYMPRPLDPTAEFQTPGSGGVIDDTGLCDDLVRQLQGTAQLGGTGRLVDASGNDVYVAEPRALQDFQPGIVLAHGSQAFGSLGGFGMLYDGAGRDAYLTGAGDPMPGRGDGVTEGATISPEGGASAALFVDRSA